MYILKNTDVTKPCTDILPHLAGFFYRLQTFLILCIGYSRILCDIQIRIIITVVLHHHRCSFESLKSSLYHEIK